ncbi:LysR family transcriptional regulator [Pseudomonas oryzihabitans]|uniref:LysR family transcriptional regulator n=1 Tax=Pseudomonas oryzihabitans TaxID=47885 RepID=UPI0011A339BB|nr:LysR family transcriptional regulator [Pseudomonas oryzihabitans]QEU01909.1 LysR family transcriptional regulator [Pseudomonas oryzihabitans]
MQDIQKVDLNLLKALNALLDERNVTRAAASLGVTQPAMSGMLTRLRQTFDDPLFVRGQRGIVPTQRALNLSMPLKQVIAEIDVLLQPPVFDPANARLTFTLAATDYALRAVGLPFLAALKVQAPYVQVALVPVDDRQVQAQLERGDIDVALVTREGTAPDLHARNLFAEHYVCVLREGHPAIQAHASLTLERLCELDHALVSYHGGGFRGVTDEALERLGRTRRVSLSVKSFLILPEILRTSDMVAILPSRLVAGMPGLQVFDPPLDIAGFTKVACWHERTHRDPGQRWLRALLFQTCSDQHG